MIAWLQSRGTYVFVALVALFIAVGDTYGLVAKSYSPESYWPYVIPAALVGGLFLMRAIQRRTASC